MADEGSVNSTLNKHLHEFLKYVATNPKDFLFYVFLFLTPLMVICGILSLKLAHHIEQRDKEKKKKGKSRESCTKKRCWSTVGQRCNSTVKHGQDKKKSEDQVARSA